MNSFQGTHGLFEMLGLYRGHSYFTHLKGHILDDELHPFSVKRKLEKSLHFRFLIMVSLSLPMKNSEMLLSQQLMVGGYFISGSSSK